MGWGVDERLYLTLHFHYHNDAGRKGYFKVSLIVAEGRSHETVSINHNVCGERESRRAEAEGIEPLLSPSACQPSILLSGGIYQAE